jgi:O-antigen ligase
LGAWRLPALLIVLAAVNVEVGAQIGGGRRSFALLVAAAPVIVLLVAWVGLEHPSWLVSIGFALAAFGVLVGPLPGSGRLYPTDVVVVLGFVAWAAARLVGSPARHVPWPRTPVLGWPFALFALAVVGAVIRGHASWGTSYFSQPLRLPLYALVAGALAGASARSLYRGLVTVFYCDVVLQTLSALYHAATGTSQALAGVSTGGTRVLALSSAMYLAGAMVLAVLNLELERDGRRQHLHLLVGFVAALDVFLAFGRTTFAAVSVVLPLLVIGLRHARRTVVMYAPLVAPVAALVLALLFVASPSLPTTFVHRVTGSLSTDPSAITRKRERDAVVHGIGAKPIFGFGFGRPVSWVALDGRTRTTAGEGENSYAWILASGGVSALAAFVILILSFFADAFRRLRRAEGEARALVAFAMAMLFIVLVNAATGPILSTSRFLLTIWICLLLPSVVDPGSGRAARAGREIARA